MRLRLTGGYAQYANGLLTDRQGQDVSLAAIKVALVPVGAATPAKTAADWKPPSAISYPNLGTARISLLVHDGDYPIGRYRFMAQAVDSPESEPVDATNDIIELV
jgi:hypothetical protein